MTSNQPSPRADLVESLIDLIKNHGTREFADAKNWFTRARTEGAEEAFIVRLAEALANTLLDGLVQLSMEEVIKTTQYQDAVRSGTRELELTLSRKLPTQTAYVEFVPRYGSIEIAIVRYEFAVESQVEAKNIRVVLENDRISQASFGSLGTTLTLTIQAAGVKVEIGTIRKELKLEYEFNPSTETEAETKPSGPAEPSSTTRKCSSCGTEIQVTANFCKTCGTKQETITGTTQPVPSGQVKETNFCRKCGARIPGDSMYCMECGTILS